MLSMFVCQFLTPYTSLISPLHPTQCAPIFAAPCHNENQVNWMTHFQLNTYLEFELGIKKGKKVLSGQLVYQSGGHSKPYTGSPPPPIKNYQPEIPMSHVCCSSTIYLFRFHPRWSCRGKPTVSDLGSRPGHRRKFNHIRCIHKLRRQFFCLVASRTERNLHHHGPEFIWSLGECWWDNKISLIWWLQHRAVCSHTFSCHRNFFLNQFNFPTLPWCVSSRCVHTYAALRCKCMLLLNAACDELRCAVCSHIRCAVLRFWTQYTTSCAALHFEAA